MSVVKNTFSYEEKVIEYVSSFVDTSRPETSTKYSDLMITRDGKSSWVEVKMDQKSQLGSPRFVYIDKHWKPQGDSPMAQICANHMNQCEKAKTFIDKLNNYLGTDDYSLTKSPSVENAVPLETMRKFVKTLDKKYITENDNFDVSSMVKAHYLDGKAEPAHYMLAGDSFYRLSKENPLLLPDDIPILEGQGFFKVSISVRSKFYEILPRIKLYKYPESMYSIKPGTQKKNPFTI
jgi:hypothetical protein